MYSSTYHLGHLSHPFRLYHPCHHGICLIQVEVSYLKASIGIISMQKHLEVVVYFWELEKQNWTGKENLMQHQGLDVCLVVSGIV